MSPSPTDKNSWIQRFGPGSGNRVRLMCFPHAGGSASYFFPFSGALGPDVGVRAVQYPGRQDRRREALVDNIPELADRVFEALAEPVRDDDCDLPFAFFGHSMGAVVAFEVARRFQAAGSAGPVRLFASGRRAPSQHRVGTAHLREDSGLIAELRSVGGTDPRFLADEEMLAAILPVTRNDYKAVETYVWSPGPPLDCPITALVGDRDPQTSIEEARSWAGHTAASFGLHVFSGGHFYLDAHRDEVVRTIAEALSTVGRKELKEVRS